MKRIILGVSAFLATLFLLAAPVAAQSAFWTLSMSAPAAQTTRTFNVAYNVLSTDSESFTVNLLDQSNAVLQTQHTNTDPNAINGNSGTFTVSVPADGQYSYHVKAILDSNPSETQSTTAAVVTVDATPPAAPSYGGKTHNGSTYTLTFTAPAGSTTVKVFASTSTSFTTSSATQVGTVAATPGVPQTFSYNSSATLYFAVQAFDAAGNGSTVTGDSGTVVTVPATSTTAGSTSTTTASGTTTTSTPTTTSATPNTTSATPTTTSANGTVDANGASSTKNNKNAKVLGAQVTKVSTTQKAFEWAGVILVAAIVVGAITYYFLRTRPSVK